jgi:hypothetical protein
MLTQKGFIKLGSSTSSHIIITNPYVNHNHLKIIYSTNLHQIGKSSYSFEAKKKPLTDVYIRDVSNSNRTKYVINNENNYFIVKNGMRFGGIGLMNGLF